MHFVASFLKTADLDRNLGGNEYDRAKGQPEAYAPNVGAAGVANSNIPQYQPIEMNKKDRKKHDALFIAQGKLAEGVGSQNLSDTDPGIVDQLKYEKSDGLTPDQLGYQGKKPKPRISQSIKKSASVFQQAGKALSGLKSGLMQAGKSTVGESLKLKGLSHISDAIKNSGGLSNAVKSESGRKALSEGVGKAAPSIAAATAYGVAAKKLYDRMSKSNEESQYYQ